MPDLDAGIGVSQGLVIAGNIGATQRLEYTVIGDPVNEAARLTEQAKDQPGRVVASQRIVDRAASGERDRVEACSSRCCCADGWSRRPSLCRAELSRSRSLSRSPSPSRWVGEGDGGAATGASGFGGDDSLLARRTTGWSRWATGSATEPTLGGVSSAGVGDGESVRPLASTLGAAESGPGTFGRTAATVDEPACSELVNVTTVAAATVVITAAAANLYSLVGGTVELPWMRTWSRQRHPP